MTVHSRLSVCPAIEDLRQRALRRVPKTAFDYIEGGAGSEQGLRANIEAFSDMTLTPRYFVDVAKRSTEVTLFGRHYAHPFGIAPVGLAGLMWPGVDAMLAQAAQQRRLPYILSTPASLTIEQAAELAPGNVWFQLYVLNDDGITTDLLRRAREAGIDVIVVTIDLPVPARRERDIRNQFTLPLRPSLRMACDVATHPSWALAMLCNGVPQFANLVPYAPKGQTGAQSLAAFMAAQFSPSVTWDAINRIRVNWPGKLLVKGLLSAADARDAVDHGVDGLVVSNHGGRQLDAAPATLNALPAIAAVVARRVPVLLDSGVRRGIDIAKAIALGADSPCSAELPFMARAQAAKLA